MRLPEPVGTIDEDASGDVPRGHGHIVRERIDAIRALSRRRGAAPPRRTPRAQGQADSRPATQEGKRRRVPRLRRRPLRRRPSRDVAHRRIGLGHSAVALADLRLAEARVIAKGRPRRRSGAVLRHLGPGLRSAGAGLRRRGGTAHPPSHVRRSCTDSLRPRTDRDGTGGCRGEQCGNQAVRATVGATVGIGVGAALGISAGATGGIGVGGAAGSGRTASATTRHLGLGRPRR